MVLRKRNFRKRNVRRRGRGIPRRRKTNKKIFASRELITYIANQRMPFPPRYRTKFHIGNSGEISAGSKTGVYNIWFNGLAKPFDMTPLSGLFSMPNPLVDITMQTCVGYNNLCSSTGPYSGYRVFASSITVQMIPYAVDDAVMIVVLPQVYDAGATPVPASSLVAQDLPYSKNKVSMTNQLGSPLRNMQTVHKLYGVKKNVPADDISGHFDSFSQDNPDSQALWTIAWNTLNNTNLTEAVLWKIDVTYYVELFDVSTTELLQGNIA